MPGVGLSDPDVSLPLSIFCDSVKPQPPQAQGVVSAWHVASVPGLVEEGIGGAAYATSVSKF